MKVAMEPYYMSGRWPNMRRGSVWVARKIPTQMGEMRPIEQISDYRTPIARAVSGRRGDASGRRGDRGVGVQLLAGYERGSEALTDCNDWNGWNFWNV